MNKTDKTHPYIPNSVPEIKQAMLDYIGVTDSEELFSGIPEHLRSQAPLDIPKGIPSEFSLKRHVQSLLNKNLSCDEAVSFLGGGCYQHQIPAICDEINGRSEFLTAYAGEPYDDHGRFQVMFEYCSMMAELLELDVVSVPCYDGFQASATALSMAARLTKKKQVLVSANIDPAKLSMMQTYCQSNLTIRLLDYDEKGMLDQVKLQQALKDQSVAAVYFEVPSFLGQIEDAPALVDSIHQAGALAIVAVNPMSLGVLTPPGQYGADIVCGDIQPLGIHMQGGGGQGGFIASANNPDLIAQYPSRLFGLIPTKVDGEYGFGDVAYDRTSFAHREEGNEFVGTAAALWGITAGSYLASMGPQGMQEIGLAIMQNTLYAKQQLSSIKTLRIPLNQPHFQEFIIDFNQTGKKVAEINKALLEKNIFAGHDLSQDFPELGESALYCFSEIHSKTDIDTLVSVLKEEVK